MFSLRLHARMNRLHRVKSSKKAAQRKTKQRLKRNAAQYSGLDVPQSVSYASHALVFSLLPSRPSHSTSVSVLR